MGEYSAPLLLLLLSAPSLLLLLCCELGQRGFDALWRHGLSM